MTVSNRAALSEHIPTPSENKVYERPAAGANANPRDRLKIPLMSRRFHERELTLARARNPRRGLAAIAAMNWCLWRSSR